MYYNMSYPHGVPQEWLEDLKLLLAHGVTIKQVLIGLDDIDTAHYRPLVGNMMIDRMFGTGTPPQDFGVWVTENNVEEHIRALESQANSQ